MNRASERAITNWLLTVCVLITLMVLLGGYVRLTRSGLSIVEWNPVSGVVPPIGEQAWQVEFEKYQQTPEFQKVNHQFTLDEYKRIFYVEYIHRLIARMAGLIVVIPLFYFVWKQWIPWRKSGIYWLIAALFGFQGFLGWYMVSSGLENRPTVSHFRLTIHLLMALSLLALTLWMALNRMVGERDWRRAGGTGGRAGYGWTWVLMAVLVLADLLWRAGGRTEGGPCLQHLAADVWLLDPAGPAQRGAALVAKSLRNHDHRPLCASLAGLHRPLCRDCGLAASAPGRTRRPGRKSRSVAAGAGHPPDHLGRSGDLALRAHLAGPVASGQRIAHDHQRHFLAA